MSDRFELTILSNLIHNEDYTRKVLPFLKEDYFKTKEEVILFKKIEDFVTKYNNLPNKEALTIELSNSKNITEEEFKLTKNLLDSLQKSDVEYQWLLDTTRSE